MPQLLSAKCNPNGGILVIVDRGVLMSPPDASKVDQTEAVAVLGVFSRVQTLATQLANCEMAHIRDGTNTVKDDSISPDALDVINMV